MALLENLRHSLDKTDTSEHRGKFMEAILKGNPNFFSEIAARTEDVGRQMLARAGAGAALVLGCWSCPWVLVYFLGACLLFGRLFTCWGLVYVLGACLFVGCLFTLGCLPTCWVKV